MRSVVVLPAPFGPRKPVIRPGSIAKLSSSTAMVEPKRFVSPRTSSGGASGISRPAARPGGRRRAAPRRGRSPEGPRPACHSRTGGPGASARARGSRPSAAGTADARRRRVPSTTNSFSVVTTRCVRSHFQTARRVSSAATITSNAPGSCRGQGWASRMPPTSASTSAWLTGRASTTPCRRASRQTCSSREASIPRGFYGTVAVPPLFGSGPARGKTVGMGQTARKAAVSTIVVIAIVALALALWKLKIVIALVFLGFVLAAAMRPGVDRLAAWRFHDRSASRSTTLRSSARSR